MGLKPQMLNVHAYGAVRTQVLDREAGDLVVALGICVAG